MFEVGKASELQIIFTVVSVFTKENFNPFSNLISPFGIGIHEIQWLFSIFLMTTGLPYIYYYKFVNMVKKLQIVANWLNK